MNLALSLLYAAERTPAAEALVDGEERVTYAVLRERAARSAAGLAAAGLGRGDRLAAVLKNRRQTVELFWACQWLGAVFVPLSWRSAQADVDYCIEDAGATLVATEDDQLQRLPATDEYPGALDLDDEAISIMLYTSGTTGRPKGVPRSHRAERAGGLAQVVHHGLAYGDRTLGVMPLYHTMGDHSMIAMSLIGGCYVVQTDWSPAAALELIERERITSLYLAPTLFHDLVTHPALGNHDVSSVRRVAYAGAAMTTALAEKVAAAFDPEVFVNHYGSTEIYTYTVHRDQRAKPGCAGRPALNARLRLDPPGAEGEVLCHLSSDEAFSGYWHRPDADAQALDDGWYRTGDVARVDADGDLWIVGRTDDLIVSGGENIHPLEVEDVLASHPGVREVAVVGAPDDRLGHRVVACVVGDATAQELDAHCLASETLARFKRPREYRFVSELPKSPSGKILRRMLRDETTERV